MFKIGCENMRGRIFLSSKAFPRSQPLADAEVGKLEFISLGEWRTV